MIAPLQRRLLAELDLLHDLARLNPQRLSGLAAHDTTFQGTLHGIPSRAVVPSGKSDLHDLSQWITDHSFRLHYPVHFPAVPMELYLQMPVQHPNIHPETGFVCLWERHRADNNAETALHKLAAMLSGQLYNLTSTHVMQPDALAWMGRDPQPAALLIGLRHSAADALQPPASGRRRLL